MKWRVWLRPERLIPSATILLAFIAQALEILKVVDLSIGEEILLTLIGLLAVDALTERLTVLREIRQKIEETGMRNVRASDIFRTRIQQPALEDILLNAQCIDIAGMSLLGISTLHHELFLQKVREGCRMRFLLLNPENEALMRMTSSYVGALTPEMHKQEIVISLNTLKSDPALLNSELVQIRISDYPLAHGLLVVDGDAPHGEMQVEMYVQERRSSRTPSFFLRRSEDPIWFDVFWTEFNARWEKATPMDSMEPITRDL